ncbi:MAG: hypothetical protein AAFS10_14535, partial [Myxococcota bacterium]
LQTGRLDTLDWDAWTQAFVGLVQRCLQTPDQFASLCLAFAQQELSHSTTSDLVSPILNAIDPDTFPFIHPSTRDVVGYLGHEYLGSSMTAYPNTQEVTLQVLSELDELLTIEGLDDVRPEDLFSMFCWWQVELRREPLYQANTWRVGLGEDPSGWEVWREEGFVAIGWEELGDLRHLDHDRFVERRNELLEDANSAKRKKEMDQVWRFSSAIHEGDQVVRAVVNPLF